MTANAMFGDVCEADGRLSEQSEFRPRRSATVYERSEF